METEKDAFNALVVETNVQRGIQHATARLFWKEALKYAENHARNAKEVCGE